MGDSDNKHTTRMRAIAERSLGLAKGKVEIDADGHDEGSQHNVKHAAAAVG